MMIFSLSKKVCDQFQYAAAIFREDNHGEFAKFFQKTGWLWAAFYLAFFGICKFILGYEENFILRGVSTLLFFVLWIFIPQTERGLAIREHFIDATLIFCLPILFTAHLVWNHSNTYWIASLIFAAVVFGLFARSRVSLPGYSLASFGTAFYLSSGEELRQVSGIILVAATISFICSIARAFLKHYVHEFIFLREQHRRDEVIRVYVSPTVLKEIDDGKNPLQFKTRIETKAVLMTDIVGYTNLTEDAEPDSIKKLLDEYFDNVWEAVNERGGETNKYIGDATLCDFKNADDCLSASIEILRKNDEIQARRKERGEAGYRVAIGLAFGDVTVGNFGTKGKVDRTIIGDIVNACKRIESLTRIFGIDLLISADFVNALKRPSSGIRLLTKTLVKGKLKPIEIFEVYLHRSLEIQNKKNQNASELKVIAEQKKETQEDWDIDLKAAVKIVDKEENRGLQMVKAE